jgi:hypothetical protein
MVRKIRNRLQKRKREEAEGSNENVKRLKPDDDTESKSPTIEINTDANTTVIEHILTLKTQSTIEIEAQMEELQQVIEIVPPQEVDTVENEHNVSATEVFTPEGTTEIPFSENENNQNTLWRMFGYVKGIVFG